MISTTTSNSLWPLEPAYLRLAERVRHTFATMPGLAVICSELAEWLELESDILGERILDALVEEGVLERGQDGRYRRLIYQ